MDRRQFIITGSVTLAAGLWAGTSGAGRPATALRAAIFDTRFQPAREFARTARGLGLPVYGFDGDVTALWADHLQNLWRARGGAVAGLTSASALQCLEEMARDHWHRVTVRIEHSPAADGRDPWAAAPPLVSWVISRRIG